MRLSFVILAYCLVIFSFAPVVAEPLHNNESVLLLDDDLGNATFANPF